MEEARPSDFSFVFVLLKSLFICSLCLSVSFRMANLKIELSKLKSEAWPGALEMEKEKLMLINEKEELLKELQFVTSFKRTQDELKHLEAERKRLEEELSLKSTPSDELTERYRKKSFPSIIYLFLHLNLYTYWRT